MPITESDVLKPADPSLHVDERAEFLVTDASFVYESNGKPANLLVAYADTPLKLQGRLETPRRQHSHYLLQKPYKPTDIVVRNVTRYAYAECQEGSKTTYKIWALGEAGWFEIQPAAHYRATYDDMLEAIQILYFVTDIYNEPRKRGGGPSASLIYQEYAEDNRFPCTNSAEAGRIFHRHRNFLLMSFLNRVMEIGWSNTPLYQTLRRQFPRDFKACKARHEGRDANIKPGRIEHTKTSPAPAATAKLTSRKAQPAKGKAVAPGTVKPPKKDDNWWEAVALFEFMQKAVNQRVVRAGRNSITVDRIAQLIIKRYEIEDLGTARNVLLVHAQNLCYMMDHPRRQNIRFFAAEPIYGELAAGHSLTAAEHRRAEGVELRPRKDHGTLRGEESESSDTSEEDDTILTPVRRVPGRSKKGILSVLRPTSGKFSGKGKGLPLPPLLPPSSPPTPHPGTASPPLPLRYLPGTTQPASPSTQSTQPLQPLQPTLVSTPLPTYTPNGPRDSWICRLDGCAQKIYGCSKPVGRQLIAEHLEDHARGREKVVGVLWRERERLNLPVENLIRRIREISKVGTPLFPRARV
ncbi:hypothetical protein EJ07DRAFT_167561 [Lizonia empirigonia]|nr:hypothetical protein EJ07DRAFT_167561 [Lizonia empirigonia]